MKCAPMSTLKFIPKTVEQLSINPQIIKISDGKINIYYFDNVKLINNDILREIHIPLEYNIYRCFDIYIDKNSLCAKTKNDKIINFINYADNSGTRIHFKYDIIDNIVLAMIGVYPYGEYLQNGSNGSIGPTIKSYHLLKTIKFYIIQNIQTIESKYNILKNDHDDLVKKLDEQDKLLKTIKCEIVKKDDIIETMKTSLDKFNALLEEFSTLEFEKHKSIIDIHL
jgi:hypothetical protein